MSKHEYIAYLGKKFVIEWYYDANGRSQALEYADTLEKTELKKLAAILMVMGDIGQLRNEEKFRYEGDKIYAFKPKPHRFLSFFYAGNKIVITNAFVKKQDKMPAREKEKALACMKDYEQRNKKGRYYETQ